MPGCELANASRVPTPGRPPGLTGHSDRAVVRFRRFSAERARWGSPCGTPTTTVEAGVMTRPKPQRTFGARPPTGLRRSSSVGSLTPVSQASRSSASRSTVPMTCCVRCWSAMASPSRKTGWSKRGWPQTRDQRSAARGLPVVQSARHDPAAAPPAGEERCRRRRPPRRDVVVPPRPRPGGTRQQRQRRGVRAVLVRPRNRHRSRRTHAYRGRSSATRTCPPHPHYRRRLAGRSRRERIKICYEPDNPASKHLYLSAGFEPDRQTEVLSGPTSRGVLVGGPRLGR